MSIEELINFREEDVKVGKKKALKIVQVDSSLAKSKFTGI